MNKTYLALKYPVYIKLGIFMYFYKDNKITAVLNFHNDKIIQHYDDETETLV